MGPVASDNNDDYHATECHHEFNISALFFIISELSNEHKQLFEHYIPQRHLPSMGCKCIWILLK